MTDTPNDATHDPAPSATSEGPAPARPAVPWPVSAGGLVLVSLGLGALAVALWIGLPPGLNIPLVLAPLVASMLALSRAAGTRFTPSTLALVIAIAFFAIACVVLTAPALLVLNCLACAVLIVLLAAERQLLPPLELTPLGWLFVSLQAAVMLVARPVTLLAATVQELRTQGNGSGLRRFAPALLAVLLALPLLAVFVPLMMAADAVFADWVQRVFEFLRWDELWWRLLLVAIFGGFAATLLAVVIDRGAGTGITLERLPVTDAFTRPDRRSGGARFLPAAVTAIALGILAVPFVAFLVFQLRYLFLSEEALGYGLTQLPYADYARAGFGQMLAVAVLVSLLLYGLDWLTRRDTPRGSRALDLMTGVLIACSLVILVSAFRRMALYEEAHALTWLRLLAQSFIVVVGLGLVTLGAALVSGRVQLFPAAVLVLAVGYLAALNLLNPEARIAGSNVDHVTVWGKDFDRRNLFDLGPDAVPTLMARYGELPDLDQRAVLQLLEVQRRTLARFGGIDDPRGWNHSRIWARDALEAWAPALNAACLDRAELEARAFAGPLGSRRIPSEFDLSQEARRRSWSGFPTFCVQPDALAVDPQE